MKICIGIISYLPDNSSRIKRQVAIQQLFNKIDELFPNIPILLIDQNWKNYTPKLKNTLIRFKHNEPLGIIKARQVLRDKFLDSNFDYMIMLDDDSKVIGTDGSDYLKEIENHPDGFGWFSNHLLKLFAISKNIYSQIEMPNVDAEKYEAFEDKLFISMCRIRFPEYEFQFSHDKLQEVSYGDLSGPPSTWWNDQARKHRAQMRAKTDELIKEYMVKYNRPDFEIPQSTNTLADSTNKEIDIVVTYVNNQDPKWQANFNYWKRVENLIDETDEQTVNEARFRDPGIFKYFFRSVENNCPWVRNIFLILANESQIPNWLNINNPKLKIVYHKEYIPTALLPTFNSNVIEFYLSNIKELSETYILCNDDTFFLNPIPSTMFFVGNKPVYKSERVNSWPLTDSWRQSIVNNNKFLGISRYYKHYHLQTPHLKSIEQELINTYPNYWFNCFGISKFRHAKNHTPWLFDDALKQKHLGIEKDSLYLKSKNITLTSDLNLENFRDYELLCINDTEANDDPENNFKKTINFLDSIFPDKSSFEL